MSRRNVMALAAGAVAGVLVIGMTAVGALAATGSVTATPRAETPIAATVGEFAVQLARALQLPGPRGGFSSESASLALWKVGVKVSPDHRKPLTEQEVTGTLSQMGFSLTSEEPGRSVSRERAETIIDTFVNSGVLAGRFSQVGPAGSDATSGDDFNNGNGKGGKFKRKGPRSPGSGGGDD